MNLYDAALLCIGAICASEALLHLPLMQQVHGLNAASRKSFATIASKRISDHWKERVLPAYSGRMARCSILFFVMLCVALAPLVLVGLIAQGGLPHWVPLLMTPAAIALLCGASLGYIVLRLKVLNG